MQQSQSYYEPIAYYL